MRYFFTILFIVVVLNTLAQDKILYMEHNLAQSISLNPAVQISCNKYFGLPALSSLKFDYNSSFSYKEMLRAGKGYLQDSIVFDYPNLYAKASNNNYLKAKAEVVWLDFGFRKRNRYFSFALKSLISTGFYYAKDLLRLPSGNWNFDQNKTLNFNLKGTGPEVLAYTALSATVSQKVNKHWQYGIRLSYLQGSAHVHAQKTEIKVKTNIQPLGITIIPNYKLNAALPLELTYDSLGRLNDWHFAPTNPLHDFLLNNNHGISMDIGFVYHQNDLIISGSLLNMGGIYWASLVHNLESNRSITFTGVDLRSYLNGNSLSTNIKANLKDSVKQILQFNPSAHSYFSLLPLNLFLGIKYSLLSKLDVSLSNELIYNYTQFLLSSSLSGDYRLNSFLNLQLNVSYLNRRFDNFGLGILTKFRAMQFYFFSEKIPLNYFRLNSLPLFLPYTSRAMNFRVGLNFVFGCTKKDISRDNMYCPAYR